MSMSPSSTLHRRSWDLIPWIVNGTAQLQERAEVESHLAQCRECREELQFQSELQTGMVAQTPDAIAAGMDVERGWQHLRARLDREPGRATDRALSDSIPEDKAGRFLEPREGPPERTWWHASRSNWAVGWAVAAVLEAVALAGLGLALSSRVPSSPAGAWLPAYRTLAQAQAMPQSATIRLVLEPRTTLAQLQGMLERSGLQIVGGPSKAGVWSLAPSSASGSTATEAALRSLRADPAVRFAEPLGTVP